MACRYASSVSASASPRYVPTPIEDIMRPCCSRKCPRAMESLNRSAYLRVDSGVAPINRRISGNHVSERLGAHETGTHQNHVVRSADVSHEVLGGIGLIRREEQLMRRL